MTHTSTFSRRSMLKGTLGGLAAAALQQAASASQQESQSIRYCAFIKFVQQLSYEELADRMASLGYDGIEATIRPGGLIEPERAVDELPKLMEALRKHNLEITVMTSGINRVDQPYTEAVLKTAVDLGVKRYRMSYYRYESDRPIMEQLDEYKRPLNELAALNRELGISAVYQNHSGPRYVGSAVWDLHYLIRDMPPQDVGVAFDIRHATVEGGTVWPLHYRLLKPHIGIIYVKDFVWRNRRPENIALGRGQVDPQFFAMLLKDEYSGPISVHVEYLQKAGLEPNVRALGNDLKTLRGYMGG